MCGFVGGSDPSWHYEEALASIAHRGPDARGLLRAEPVAVGFRRLSIIDLREAANQPMLADDGRTWIAFNGEIYGFREVRKQLEGRGHAFRTESDTEVVLRAYLEWGDAFVDHVDGMFAIAIWDANQRRLKLFRDRPGIKPLYYFHDGRRLAFGSELKAIEALLAGESLAVDPTALYDFLTYRYVPTPKTLYRNCFKLPPAHRLVFDPETGRLEGPAPFWRLPVPEDPRQRGVDEAAEELRSLLDVAVRDQMVADVPLGFFLSGGMDSSAVVASASRTGRELSTFAIGFDTAEHSETPFAREVAELFGTRHHERILSRSEAHDLLPNLRSWFDEPYADTSAFPTYLVSKTAREEVTVVLTGDGGDEIFGGYRNYERFPYYSSLPSWPRALDGLAHRLRRPLRRDGRLSRALTRVEWAMGKGLPLWAKLMYGMTEPEKAPFRARLGIEDDYDDYWHYRRFWRADLPLRTRLQFLDFHTFLPDFVLTKVDRASMAVSLEARVPLLDRRLVEFSFSLPESLRYHGDELKGLFRHAYRDILPESIVGRRKKGFGTPKQYFGDMGGMVIQEYVLRRHFLPDAPA